MNFHPDPTRTWQNRNYDESKLNGLTRRDQSALETDRDLDKPVEQLVCDVHEETHDPNRNDIQNVAGAQKRIASLMARVAKSNDKVATQLLWLTIAIAAMTLVILVYTVLMWRQNENKPNQTVDSTATRVTSPAGQEPRHGQP
jgi:nitrate/nitrite-specific signal transduction histidine kinase